MREYWKSRLTNISKNNLIKYSIVLWDSVAAIKENPSLHPFFQGISELPPQNILKSRLWEWFSFVCTCCKSWTMWVRVKIKRETYTTFTICTKKKRKIGVKGKWKRREKRVKKWRIFPYDHVDAFFWFFRQHFAQAYSSSRSEGF